MLTAGLIVHLSLVPYTGWRMPEPAAWHYWRSGRILPRDVFFPSDALRNVLAYVPLGGLAFLSVPCAWRRRTWTPVLVWLGCAALSAGLETTQMFLASRVSSKVDLACNGLGAAVGVAVARWDESRRWKRGVERAP
jgi:VanZ family protein